jgi:hypothetical protein
MYVNMMMAIPVGELPSFPMHWKDAASDGD